MASRAWASAEAVTVQVLMTTMSAAAGVGAEVQPRSSNWRSRAAPSAWVARQPNCSIKKVGIQSCRIRSKTLYPEYSESTEKNGHMGVLREPTKRRSPWRRLARIAGLEEGEKTDS